MPFYKIYAGLSGGFGGATFQGIEEHINSGAAEEAAYYNACEQFESQEGAGMEGWDDWMEEARNNLEDFDGDEEEYQQALEEYASQLEAEARETWIEYWVEETDSKDYIEE